MGYRVVAPLVYLKVPSQTGVLTSLTFYAGAPVPEDVDKDSLKHHLDSGLVIDESDKAADLVAAPAGTPTPGEPPNVAVAESGSGKPLEERLESVRKAAETRGSKK